jgi:NAD(P)H-dependent flavin oxidoreductase YrpB (nitropropane dioxygenase family)
MSIVTPVTQLLNIQHPVLLAGMGQTSGAPLAAAVCNAGKALHLQCTNHLYTDFNIIGGLGVIGGVGYTPKQLSEMITELKVGLKKTAMVN